MWFENGAQATFAIWALNNKTVNDHRLIVSWPRSSREHDDQQAESRERSSSPAQPRRDAKRGHSPPTRSLMVVEPSANKRSRTESHGALGSLPSPVIISTSPHSAFCTVSHRALASSPDLAGGSRYDEEDADDKDADEEDTDDKDADEEDADDKDADEKDTCDASSSGLETRTRETNVLNDTLPRKWHAEIVPYIVDFPHSTKSRRLRDCAHGTGLQAVFQLVRAKNPLLLDALQHELGLTEEQVFLFLRVIPEAHTKLAKRQRIAPVLQDFWDARSTVVATPLTANTSIASLGFISVYDINPTLSLFVRPCYVDMLPLVARLHRVLILGTPGIGKSVFLCYILETLLRQAGRTFDVVIDFGPFGSARFPPPPTAAAPLPAPEFSTEPATTVFSDSLYKRDTYLLYDCVDQVRPVPHTLRARVIASSSPLRTRYSAFEKCGAEVLYMPLWEDAELEACRTQLYPTLCPDNATLLARIGRWGRVARNVLTLGKNEVAKFQQYLSSIDPKAAIDATIAGVGATDLPHRVVHMVPITRPRDPHPYLRCAYRFGSARVAEHVVTALAALSDTYLKDFLTTHICIDMYGALCGEMFERYVHMWLPQQSEIRVRRLDNGAEEILNLRPRRGVTRPRTTVVFHNAAALHRHAARTDAIYLKPRIKNLAAIDSFILPHYGFQSTISTSHPIKHQGLVDIFQQGINITHLIFVLPSVRARKMKARQNMLTVDGKVFSGAADGRAVALMHNQYVLSVDIVPILP